MCSSPRAESRPFAIKTALVVDADPQVEAILRNALKPDPWVIQHAPDNKAALAQAETRAFDLILTS